MAREALIVVDLPKPLGEDALTLVNEALERWIPNDHWVRIAEYNDRPPRVVVEADRAYFCGPHAWSHNAATFSVWLLTGACLEQWLAGTLLYCDEHYKQQMPFNWSARRRIMKEWLRGQAQDDSNSEAHSVARQFRAYQSALGQGTVRMRLFDGREAEVEAVPGTVTGSRARVRSPETGEEFVVDYMDINWMEVVEETYRRCNDAMDHGVVVDESRQWIVPGWVARGAIDAIRLQLRGPVAAEVGARLQVVHDWSGGLVDLRGASHEDITALATAARIALREAEARGTAGWQRHPSFFPGYIQRFRELVALLDECLSTRESPDA